jgi:transketolase
MRRARSRHAAVLMSTGVMTTNSLAAAELLAKDGIDISVVHFHTIKPLDEAAVLDFARDADLVVTVEEGIRIGGLGSAITDVIVEQLGTAAPPVRRLGLPDEFPHNYGLQDELFDIYGLMPAQIAARVRSALEDKGSAEIAVNAGVAARA